MDAGGVESMGGLTGRTRSEGVSSTQRGDVQIRARPEVVARVLAGATVAGALSAAGSWWLSGDFANPWWLVPFVGVPVLMAMAWCGHHLGSKVLLVAGAVALSASMLGAWSQWSAEPEVIRALRTREPAATAAAEALIRSQAPGACSPPRVFDLGVLAELGPWSRVCVAGTGDGTVRVVDLIRPAESDALGLVYATNAPSIPDGCARQLTKNWWAVAQATSTSMGNPCRRGFTYQPGG